MIKTERGRTTYHCDICGYNTFVGEVSGGTRDLCYKCWHKLKDLSRVELEHYIKENKNGQ